MPSLVSGKEYSYRYSSHLLTGLPELGNQYSGLRITAIIRAQRFPDDTIRIKLEDSKFMDYNNEVINKESIKKRVMEEKEVPLSIRRHLEAPYKVLVHNDLVEKIQTEASEPEWITNIKKAAISHLLSLSKSKLTRAINSRQEFSPSLKTMETSIVGQCETLYTISELPAPLAIQFEEREMIPSKELCNNKKYFEVLKTKNLKNCLERPLYNHIYGASAMADGSRGSTSTMVEEASVSRSVICGNPDSYIVRKTENEHKYIMSPNGKVDSREKMEVASWTTVTLLSVKDQSSVIADVKSPKAHDSLMYEYPRDDSYNSVTSQKAALIQSGRQSTQESWETEPSRPQMPLPDLVSAPFTLLPNVKTMEENKEMLVHAFLRIMENAEKSPESSQSKEDVSGLVVMFTRALVRLGLQDIKALWTKIEALLPEDTREQANHSFLDLASIAGSNPAISYIIEAVKSNQVTGENRVWIVSNAIRSVKTPTEQLLKELVNLLQHRIVQDDHQLSSAVALTLSHLVYKACISRDSSVYSYPVQAYGKFCDEKSPVITRELIPFLSSKLFSAQETDIHTMITYINALGNIGHDGASVELLKVVEGAPSRLPLPRSVAVYNLMKSARSNPAHYRPVLLAIIRNYAENAEVRMAALTVLPYTRPDSAVYNELAVSTWFDPSQQVVSYIYTTLKTLSELPTHITEDNTIEIASQALKLAKPFGDYWEVSHNMVIANFLDSLKAAVKVNVQNVFSTESQFPRTQYYKASVLSKSHIVDNLEASVNVQGTEFLINKMFDAYNSMMQGEEKEKLETNRKNMKNLVRIESRLARKPEAHITVKLMGLQRIVSLDNQMIEHIIEKVTKEAMDAIKKDQHISQNFMKIIDLNGHNSIIPSETGLPVYISHQTPLVISGKTSLNLNLKDMSKGKLALTIKPVVNYKQVTQAGVFCPFTMKFLGAGVDTSVHAAIPLVAEASMHDGQYIISVTSPRDEESQKEKPVFELKVKPYTTSYNIRSMNLDPVSKASASKIIKSNSPRSLKEFNIGRPLGLALRLKIDSEHPADMAEILENLREQNPLTLLSLPLPLKSVRDHTLSLIYSPKQSSTKDVSIVLAYAHGERKRSSAKVTTSSNVQVPQHITQKCSSSSEIQREECEREELSTYVKVSCLKNQSKQSRPTIESEFYCSKMAVQSKQRHSAILVNKKSTLDILESIPEDSRAATMSVEASLHGENYSIQKKISTQISLAEKKSSSGSDEGQLKLKASVESPISHQPLEVEVECKHQLRSPVNMWNMEAMLGENLASKFEIKSIFGLREGEKDTMDMSIRADRSEEMKQFARESMSSRRCEEHIAKGLRLSQSCKEARKAASSLDKVQVEVSLPKRIVSSPYTETIARIAKVISLPYLSIESSSYNRQSANHEHYKMAAKVAPNGMYLSLAVSANGEKTLMSNIRLPSIITNGLLPYSVKDSVLVGLIQKITFNRDPPTCSIEGNRVSTFDKVVYDYVLNDCEHVLFKDSSETPKMMVTVRKTPGLHIVKAIIDHNMYELELVNAPRGSRSAAGKIKVNGVVMPANYEDKDNMITRYQDGVIEITSVKYGLTVRADAQSTQIRTFLFALRNLVSGLCGDLNDEKTGDMKSANMCIMSRRDLAAYSYMVQDNSCAGIPQEHKELYRKETQQCVKEELVPTKVMEVFSLQQENIKMGGITMKHETLEHSNLICIAKEPTKVCGNSSAPSEILRRQVEFFCVAKDAEGSILKKMAENGEKISNAYSYPTMYTRTVYEPKNC